jgi:hypothetical protein
MGHLEKVNYYLSTENKELTANYNRAKLTIEELERGPGSGRSVSCLIFYAYVLLSTECSFFFSCSAATVVSALAITIFVQSRQSGRSSIDSRLDDPHFKPSSAPHSPRPPGIDGSLKEGSHENDDNSNHRYGKSIAADFFNADGHGTDDGEFQSIDMLGFMNDWNNVLENTKEIQCIAGNDIMKSTEVQYNYEEDVPIEYQIHSERDRKYEDLQMLYDYRKNQLLLKEKEFNDYLQGFFHDIQIVCYQFMPTEKLEIIHFDYHQQDWKKK